MEGDQTVEGAVATFAKNRRDGELTVSAFSIATELEFRGDLESAYRVILIALEKNPDNFECLCLGARLSSKTKRYEKMYDYARRALLDKSPPQTFPLLIRGLMRVVSLIPIFRKLPEAGDIMDGVYLKSTKEMRDYVDWYETTFARSASPAHRVQ